MSPRSEIYSKVIMEIDVVLKRAEANSRLFVLLTMETASNHDLAAVAARLADREVAWPSTTSQENTLQVLDDVMEVIPAAVHEKEPADLLLTAGKGREDYMNLETMNRFIDCVE